MKNINNPVIKLYHQNLKRVTEESLFRSHCPFCERGVLLVSRDQETLDFIADDICISCGQKVHYLDLMNEWRHQPLKCVKCGYCCSKCPCGYGESLPDSPQCKYLTEEKLCAKYKEIIKDPASNISPAFGHGCCSPLFNTIREQKINQIKTNTKQCSFCRRLYKTDEQAERLTHCECSGVSLCLQ